MKIGAFEFHEPLPEVQDLHIIAGLRPWIDVGNVGTQTLSRLEQNFGAQEIGELARPGTFYDFTRYRPSTFFVDGQRQFTVPNTKIFFTHREDGPDFMFLHLLEPHTFAEIFTDSVVKVLKHFGATRYCRVGGMYDAVPHTRPLLVTGSISGEPLQGVPGVSSPNRNRYQGPTSIMNLVADGIADLNIENLSLMVHLPQYTQLYEDHAGAARLLEVLCNLYNLPISLVDKEAGQRQYEELDSEVGRNSDLKNIVGRLESYYEARTAPEKEDLPSLSPQIEQFLRQMGQRLGEA